MAVELRCPDCRAKLRLPHAPEPDSEIECPKCGTVFAAEDNRVFAGDGDGDEDVKAAKKKPAADEKSAGSPSPASDGGKPAAAKDQKGDKKVADKPFKRKKRKAKKKKTNPVLLWSVVGGGVLVLLFLVGILLYLFGRKTPTQEMMSYLPDDCDLAYGLNLGHMQKYPEFYKECEKMFATNGFKKAADAFTKAVGGDNLVELVMQGEGKSGESVVEATVFRTKSEFDPSKLVNLPGAKEYSAKGVKYYTIDDIPELKYGGIRVFAPNNRVVVFCRDSIPESKFNAMLTGNKENPEGGLFHRAGPLVKAVTRGTAWKLVVYGRSVPKPEPPGPKTDTKGGTTPNDEDNLKKEIADILGPSKGMGYKASVGSRDVRGEWVVWCKDSDAASALAKKWKDQEWVKDEEKTAPRWWTSMANKSGGGKTASNALKDGLGFRSSGELFSIRSSLETKVLQVGTLVISFTGQQRPGGMGGGMPGAPGGPGGAGGPGAPIRPGGPGGPGGGPGGAPGVPGGGPVRPGGPGAGPGGKPPGGMP